MAKKDDAAKVAEALEIAFRYGSFDGDHHKMWCIDQMVRALTGTKENYEAWVKEFQGEYDEEEGHCEYEWDTGTPP